MGCQYNNRLNIVEKELNIYTDMKYLFNEWHKIEAKINQKRVFIFLDFDGTLTPIMASPDKAVLPEAAKILLQSISENQNMQLAFISGRHIKDIQRKIGIKNAIYAGSHGLQVEGPRITCKPFIPDQYRTVLQRIKKELTRKLTGIPQAFIEDKQLTIALHYRLVAENERALVKNIFLEAVRPVMDIIKIQAGKMVREVMPRIAVDKGTVVVWLLAHSLFKSKDRSMYPVYIGDDLTDEDAFKALRGRGLTIYVGRPKQSYAQYYVKDHNEVLAVLERISRTYHGSVTQSTRTF